MSEIVEIIDTLEGRLKKLMHKIDVLEQTSADLKQELQKSTTVIQNQSQEIGALKKQYETLKLANSLLGSDENKEIPSLK